MKTIKKTCNTRPKTRPQTLDMYKLTKLTDIGCMNANELNWVKDCVIRRKSEIRETTKPRHLSDWNLFVKNFVMPSNFKGNRLRYIADEWKKVRPYWLWARVDQEMKKIRVRPDDTFENVFNGGYVTHDGFELTGRIGHIKDCVTVSTRKVYFDGGAFPFVESVSKSIGLPEQDLYIIEKDRNFEVALRHFDVCVWEGNSTKIYKSLLPSDLVKTIGPVMFNGQVLDENKPFYEYGIEGLVNQMFTRV